MEDPNLAKQYNILASKPSININRFKKIGQVRDYSTNQFRIQYSGPQTIFTYTISIQPELNQDSRDMINKIIGYARRSQSIKDKFGENYLSGLNLYSFKEVQEVVFQEVKYEDKEYNVGFKKTGSVSMQDLTPESKGKNSNISTMVLNVMMKDCLKKLGLREMGRLRKFYDSKKMLDNQIQYNTKYPIYCHSGVMTSVHLCESSNMLQVDYSTRVINGKTLLDCMYDYDSDDIASQNLTGKSVFTSYGNHRNYIVDGFHLNKNPNSTFVTDKGEKITFKDYFKKQYNVTIKDLKQSLAFNIQKNTNKEIILIPELLMTTGISDQERNDFKFMNELARYTKLTPGERAQKYMDFLQRFQTTSKDLPYKIFPNSNICPGTELSAPKIRMNKWETIQGGQFQIRNNILNPASLKNWVFIYTSKGKRDDDQADRFLNDLIKVGKGFGISIEEPGFITISDEKPQNYIKELEKDIKKNGNPNFVLSMSFNKNTSLYKELKNYLISKLGIPHSHFTIKAYEKAKLSGVTKILTQINAKLGKPIWEVEQVEKCPKNLMLIGIDSCSFVSQGKKKTVTGIIATMNNTFNETWSKAIINVNDTKGLNIIGSINSVIKEAIMAYAKANATMPTHIILFKEGAGDSQISNIVQDEMNGITQGFNDVKQGYDPQFAYIMFNKKINFRFFDQSSQGGGQRGGKGMQTSLNNPNPGSLIYKDFVGSNAEFYLVPQKVTQGSATPTKFIICQNTFDSSFEFDFFTQLTYFQCYNYFNWSGAVRVPGVAQYARKLANLVGDTFRQPVHEQLRYGQYYL